MVVAICRALLYLTTGYERELGPFVPALEHAPLPVDELAAQGERLVQRNLGREPLRGFQRDPMDRVADQHRAIRKASPNPFDDSAQLLADEVSVPQAYAKKTAIETLESMTFGWRRDVIDLRLVTVGPRRVHAMNLGIGHNTTDFRSRIGKTKIYLSSSSWRIVPSESPV